MTLVAAAVCAPSATAQLPPLPPIIPPGTEPPPSSPPPPSDPSPAPVSAEPGSVSVGVDPAHTGHFADDGLVPPLVKTWSALQTGTPRAMLAADGRVYVDNLTTLTALDQATGRELWKVQGSHGESLAAGSGMVFRVTSNELTAYRGENGAVAWTVPSPGNTSWDGVVASDSAVYAVNSDTLHALRPGDGSELWKTALPRGTGGVPAVDDTRVYLSGNCGAVAAVNRTNGGLAWENPSTCSNGGRLTPTVLGGRLYNPERPSSVFDAANGTRLGEYSAGQEAIFVDGLLVTANEPRVVATDVNTGAEVWKVPGKLQGLVAVGHDIYGIGDRHGGKPYLVALDSETGAILWREDITAGSGSERGIAAVAPGRIFVAFESHVSAFESYFRPDPAGIALGYDGTEVITGGKVPLVGVAGTGVRGSRPDVQVEGAGWRGGKFAARGPLKMSRDGGFGGTLTINRNTRIRVTAAGAASNTVTAYAWPRVRFGKFRASGRRHVAVGHTVRTPGVNVRGMRLVMYLDRKRTKTLTRLATARLRGAGRGRTRADMRFVPPRKVSNKDYLVLCIERGLSRGLGRPISLTRRCGARSIRE